MRHGSYIDQDDGNLLIVKVKSPPENQTRIRDFFLDFGRAGRVYETTSCSYHYASVLDTAVKFRFSLCLHRTADFDSCASSSFIVIKTLTVY